MKINNTPPNLSSLVDANLRDTQQNARNQQELKQKQDNDSTKQAQRVAKNPERQSLIDANKAAIKKLQQQLKADSLEKLKTETAVAKSNDQKGGVNLNLRESLGGHDGPAFTHIGQIIDITV